MFLFHGMINYRFKGERTTWGYHQEQTVAKGCREAQPSPSDIIYWGIPQSAAEIRTKESRFLLQIDVVPVYKNFL